MKFIDVGGDSIWIYYKDEDDNEQKMLYTNGMEYKGENKFVASVVGALNTIGSKEYGAEVVGTLEATPLNVNIEFGTNFYSSDYKNLKTTITWDPENKDGYGLNAEGNTTRPPFIGLTHELGHGFDAASDAIVDNSEWGIYTDVSGKKHTIFSSEKEACRTENRIRIEHGIPRRVNYLWFNHPKYVIPK